MADNKVFPKQQLEIVQVQDPKPYSGGQKFLLPVMAKNLSLSEDDPGHGKSWKYTVFNQALRTISSPFNQGRASWPTLKNATAPTANTGPTGTLSRYTLTGSRYHRRPAGAGTVDVPWKTTLSWKT